MRRAHDGLAASPMSECPNCGDIMRPHHACPHCGHYKGREIVAKGEA
jgi:large subunit ribosomal protein L32